MDTKNEVHITFAHSDFCDNTVCARHCHARYEIIFITDGAIEINIEGEKRVARAGEAIFVEPMKYHTLTGQNCAYRRLLADFPERFVPEAIRARFRASIRVDPVVISPDSGRIFGALARILQCADASAFAPLAESLLTQAIYLTAFGERGRTREEISESENAPIARKITAYINSNLDRPLTLSSIAGALFMSESSVWHIFKSEMNVTPKQYILNKKMSYAKNLIDGGTPPTAAAELCGYPYYGSFYKAYLSVNGCAPSKKSRS